MTEEETKSVTPQEAAAPEVNSQSQESHEASQVASESQEKENSKEYNFSRLRKKNEELERQIYELRDSFERKNAPVPEPDELDSLGEDDIVTMKQARRLAERQAEAIIEKKLKEKETAALPDKTRTQFNDYDQVMTLENVKKFEQEEPGLAAACAKAPNPWEATYKMLKKFVLPQSEVKSNKLEEKMKDNMSKPVSSNALGRNSPLNNANVWAEASKDELYKEMMRAAKRG